MLHVLEAVGGGTSQHVYDLVRWTPGTEQHAAVPEQRVGGLSDVDVVARLEDAGAQVHIVPMTRLLTSRDNVRALRQIRRLAKTLRPDIVHAHSSVAGGLARIALAGARVPVVYTPNGLHPHPVSRRLERLLAPLTTRIITVSGSERELLVDWGICPRDKVALIRNGIDEEPLPEGPNLRALAGIPASAPLLLMVGRMVSQKLPLDVVEAFVRVMEKVPEAYGLVVGDGKQTAAVDAAIAASGVADRLRRLPPVPDIAGSLHTATVLVSLSAFEGAPYVPLEAMRARVPVVVSDVTGNRDTVTDGVTGLLVPAGDPLAAAEAILRLLEDADLRASLVEAASTSLNDLFSVASMGRAHAAVYGQIVTSSH